MIYYIFIIRYSFIITLFSSFEKLLFFAERIKIKKGLNVFTYNRSGADLIKQFRSYMEIYAKLEPLPLSIWESLKDLSKVRICIMHYSGEIKNYRFKDVVERIAKKNIGLSISPCENEIINLEKRFCEYALNSVEEFTNELFKQI